MISDDLRKWIGSLPDSPGPEQILFNLEAGKRTKIQGMITDRLLAAEGKNKAVGKAWHRLPEDAKDAIVRVLINTVDEEETHEILMNDFGLTAEQADGALSVDLMAGPTKGYMNFSLTAINKLLPHLERGFRLMGNDESDSAMHAAGYLRRDQLKRRIFDKLPDPARVRDAPIGDIPNPVVKRTIVELRKVVNAIIREYGRPEAVHVEMAREVRQGTRQRAETNVRNRDAQASRDIAKAVLDEHNLPYGARGVNILRVQLWEQQNNDCVYCGNKISQTQLFDEGVVEIDHIIPYSRSLDDSQMNKVVCHHQCNRDKGNRWPYAWLAQSDPSRYERVCQHLLSLVRSGRMPYHKYRYFIQQELDLNDFIARQLTATGYIARATVEYLKCLFEQEHDVLASKGQLTAELRRQWGVNTILGDLADSPAWREQANVGRGEKDRSDHRHHVVDATIIALTNRSRLQAMARGRTEVDQVDTETGEVVYRQAFVGKRIDPPWEGFRNQLMAKIEKLDGHERDGKRLGVSHRVQRKVAGALHKDTFYGPTQAPGVFVVRKPLESLSLTEVPQIRDGGIRRIIEQRLAEHGIEAGRGRKDDPKQRKLALCNVDNPVTMPSGVPIKKVRVLRKEKTIQPIRATRDNRAFVKPGSNHHVAIFEWDDIGKVKRDAVFTTRLEAANRVKENQPIIQRTHPDRPDARFVMSLSRGELVIARLPDGNEGLLTFLTGVSGQLRFALHTDARKRQDKRLFRFAPSTLHGRKVTVDTLGRIRWAND